MKTFFVIERVGLLSGNCFLMYFSGFHSEYDKESSIETSGIEDWSEYENESMRFETFSEAESWFKVLNKDTDNYEYSITLKRMSNSIDRDEYCGNCGDMITLKTFYTTQEN